MSVEYRPALSTEFRPRCRSTIDRHYRPSVGRLSAEVVSVEYQPALSVECQPTLSVKYRPIGGEFVEYRPRYRATHSTHILPRHLGCHSADTRPTSLLTLWRDIDRHLGEISTDTLSSDGENCTQVCRPSVATIGRSVGLHLVDSSTNILDRHLGRHSTKCRYLAPESAEMSVESRPKYRPRVGRDLGR